MGKKGTKRRTRWRALPLGGEDAGSGNEDDLLDEDRSTCSSGPANGVQSGFKNPIAFRMGARPYRQARRFPADRDRSRTKEPLIKLESKTFDEEEYTKITTPRQDVLFKKGYFGRRKHDSSLEEHSQYNGDVEGEETTMEQIIITNGFVDERGHYLVNGSSYEIYDPFTNTVTVVVGPPPYTNGVTQPVLAAMSCQPVPLQPVDWYPPTPGDWPQWGPAYQPLKPPDSVSSPGQSCESESPQTADCSDDRTPPPTPGIFGHPAYVFPGFPYGNPPVFHPADIRNAEAGIAVCAEIRHDGADDRMSQTPEVMLGGSDEIRETSAGEQRNSQECDDTEQTEQTTQPQQPDDTATEESARMQQQAQETPATEDSELENVKMVEKQHHSTQTTQTTQTADIIQTTRTADTTQTVQAAAESHRGPALTRRNESHGTQTSLENLAARGSEKKPPETSIQYKNESLNQSPKIKTSPKRFGSEKPYQRRLNFSEDTDKPNTIPKSCSDEHPIKISYAKTVMNGLENSTEKESKPKSTSPCSNSPSSNGHVVNGTTYGMNGTNPPYSMNERTNASKVMNEKINSPQVMNGTTNQPQIMNGTANQPKVMNGSINSHCVPNGSCQNIHVANHNASEQSFVMNGQHKIYNSSSRGMNGPIHHQVMNGSNHGNGSNYVMNGSHRAHGTSTNDEYNKRNKVVNGNSRPGFDRSRTNRTRVNDDRANVEKHRQHETKLKEKKAVVKPLVNAYRSPEKKENTLDVHNDSRSQSEKSSTVSELSSPTELSSGQNTPPEKLIVKKMEQKIANEINKNFEERLKQNLKKKEEETIDLMDGDDLKEVVEDKGESLLPMKTKLKVVDQKKKKNKTKSEEEKPKEVEKKSKKKKKCNEDTKLEKDEFVYSSRDIPCLPAFLQEKQQDLLFNGWQGLKKDKSDLMSDLNSILNTGDETILKSLGVSEEKLSLPSLKLSQEMLTMMLPSFRPEPAKFKFDDWFLPGAERKMSGDIFTKNNITNMKTTKPEEFFASIVEGPANDFVKHEKRKEGKKETCESNEKSDKNENQETAQEPLHGAQVTVNKNVNLQQTGYKISKNNVKYRVKEEAKVVLSDEQSEVKKNQEKSDDPKLGIVEAVNTWLQEQGEDKVLSVNSIPQAFEEIEDEPKDEVEEENEEENETCQKNGQGNPSHASSAEERTLGRDVGCRRVADNKKIKKFLSESAQLCQEWMGDVKNGLPPNYDDLATEDLCNSKQSVEKYYTLTKTSESDSEPDVFDALEYKFLSRANLGITDSTLQSEAESNGSADDHGLQISECQPFPTKQHCKLQ